MHAFSKSLIKLLHMQHADLIGNSIPDEKKD